MDPDYEAQGSGIVTLDQLRDLYERVPFVRGARGPSYCAGCSGCAVKCAMPGWRGRARRLPPSNASRN